MNTIKNIPYREATFDKRGVLQGTVDIPAGTTDLFVISHGWRNNAAEASKLYTDFFTNFADPTLVDPARLAGRQCAILGVFWPSKNFDGLVAAQGAGTPGNAASFDSVKSDSDSRRKVVDQLEALKADGIFDEPAQRQALTQAQALVQDLDDKTTSRDGFMAQLRSLMDPNAVDNEDASKIFHTMNATDLFTRLNISATAVDESIPRTANAMAFNPNVGVVAKGHAAGLIDIFKGAAAAASNTVSYLSYFMMKERAGVVGMKGLGPFLDQIASQIARVHLIGHSFGGRVVAATALASRQANIHSMSFLQAAFSHNGFSPATQMKGLFRPVIEQGRVKGPIIATYTKNDSAVGIAYPLASRMSGAVSAALGDKNDKYGGLGRNGAQKMNPGEVIEGDLLPAGGAYQFTPGKIHNLLSDQFVKDHGSVTGREVVAATAAAAL
jgi:hypothetical protein